MVKLKKSTAISLIGVTYLTLLGLAGFLIYRSGLLEKLVAQRSRPYVTILSIIVFGTAAIIYNVLQTKLREALWRDDD